MFIYNTNIFNLVPFDFVNLTTNMKNFPTEDNWFRLIEKKQLFLPDSLAIIVASIPFPCKNKTGCDKGL